MFDSHVKEVYKIAFQKLAALSPLANYLDPEERKLIFNFMIKSQFTYCKNIKISQIEVFKTTKTLAPPIIEGMLM